MSGKLVVIHEITFMHLSIILLKKIAGTKKRSKTVKQEQRCHFYKEGKKPVCNTACIKTIMLCYLKYQ